MFSTKCLTTLMLSNSPSLSFCKFSKNGNYLMYSALNNIHALYDTNLKKKEREFTGHVNENYLLEGRFT